MCKKFNSFFRDCNSFVEISKENTLIIDRIKRNKDFIIYSNNVYNTTKRIKGIKDPSINYLMKNKSLVVYNHNKYSFVKIFKDQLIKQIIILTIGFVLEIGSGAIKFTSDNNNLNSTNNRLIKKFTI